MAHKGFIVFDPRGLSETQLALIVQALKVFCRFELQPGVVL